MRYRTLRFKNTFWIVFVGVLIIQIYSFTLATLYGFNVNNFPHEYFLYHEIGGIVWFFLFVGMAIYDIRSRGIKLNKLFRFDFKLNKKLITQIVKYFFGCAAFILTISFITIETELKLEYQTQFTIALTFITAVILAPICEEMIFRGYLYSSMFSTFKRKKERMVVNAMIFAGAHVFLISFFVGATVPYYIFVIGYLLAKLYEETRSVIPCIVLHSLNNGLVFGIDVLKLYIY